MKKLTLLISALILTSTMVFSGGIVTNYNQSAAYIRMFARDATTDIDAVFFNPAGLTKLEDGWHFSFNYQNIRQDRKATSTFPYLNGRVDGIREFEGEAKIPVFPTFYSAYKTGKFVFSFGFNPIGGGGKAQFNSGLPTMENPISTLVPKLSSAGVTGYSMNSMFKGSSVFFGFQGGVSYEINENVSVFAGMRYVKAENTYEGYINDVKVITAGGAVAADAYLNGVSAQAAAGSAQALAGSVLAKGAGDGMTGLVAAAGQLTFQQLIDNVIIDVAMRAQLEGGLLQFGFTQAQIDGMNMTQAQASYYGTQVYLEGYSAELSATATELGGAAILMADQSADVKQVGSGVTPILGANFNFMDGDLNIGLKYEFKTSMDLTNETPAGMGFAIGLTSTGQKIEMFPDGAITNSDMPALLALGFEYKLTDRFTVASGFHTYFDKKTGWATNGAGQSTVDKNSTEFALGLQYEISDKFLVSCGYLNTATGANALYQSDIKHVLSSNSGSFGGAYKYSERVTFNFGVSYTKYTDLSVAKSYDLGGNNVPSTEVYSRNNLAIAFGVDFSIFK